MSTTPTPTYKPQPGSLAAKLVWFFDKNPGEFLTLEDIAEKFDAMRSSIHTALRQSVDTGLLTRSQNQDGEWIYYCPSPTEPNDKDTAALDPNKKPRKISLEKRINIDQLVVEEGIPFAQPPKKGLRKWTPLFERLKTPGQSLQIPADIKDTVAVAARNHNKLGQGTYRVAFTSLTTARVWRIA